jgi:hypothetical protein
MITRRLFGKVVAAMTVPGRGGQQTPPVNAPQGSGAPIGVQPGVTGTILRVQQVIVFGPSGAVNGVFIYDPGTVPGAGNGPVLSATFGDADPSGNSVAQGFASYQSPGSDIYAALVNGTLQLNYTGAEAAGQVSMEGPGFIAVQSGNVSAGDSEAVVTAQSADANSGVSLIALSSDQVQITGFLTVSGITDIGALVNSIVSALSGQPTSTDGLTDGTINGSSATTGLPNGGIQGTSGSASAGTAHTHGPGSYSVTDGMHSHSAGSYAVADGQHDHNLPVV